jgi:hypothetical protein
MPLGAAPIGGTIPVLEVKLDNGQTHRIEGVISHATAYWISELNRIGL